MEVIFNGIGTIVVFVAFCVFIYKWQMAQSYVPMKDRNVVCSCGVKTMTEEGWQRHHDKECPNGYIAMRNVVYM